MKVDGQIPFPERGKEGSVDKKENQISMKSLFDFNNDGVIRESEASQYLSKYNDGSQTFQSLFTDFCNRVCDIPYNIQNIDDVIDGFMPKFENIVNNMDKNSPEYKSREIVLNSDFHLNNTNDIKKVILKLMENGATDISVTETYDTQAPTRAMVSYSLNGKQYRISVEVQEPESNGNEKDEVNHLDEIKSLASTINEGNKDEVIAKMSELGATGFEEMTSSDISFFYRAPGEHTMRYKVDYYNPNRVKIKPKQDQTFSDFNMLDLNVD